MVPYKKHKTPIGRCNTKDVRALADAAMEDVTSVSTTLALLVEAKLRIAIEPEARAQLQGGIRSKVATAIISLRAINTALGGGQ